MDEEALRAMMPMGFGKAAGKQRGQQGRGAPASSLSAAVSLTPNARGPIGPMPSTSNGAVGRAVDERDSDEDDDEGAGEDGLDDDGLTKTEREELRKASGSGAEDDSDEEVDLGPEPEDGRSAGLGRLPLDQSVLLKDHNKAVSALSIDQSGARVATGSYDYDVKLWDFGGMNSAFRPYKSWEPAGSYWVHDVAWAPSNDRLLVISATAQAKLTDRNGVEIATYRKGDVYIRDMKNTSGHVSEITKGFWHPHQANLFATASTDSTIRLWDTEVLHKHKECIVVRSKERGTRTRVTAAAFSSDGRTLGAACFDGALHLWNTNSNYTRPHATIEKAHENSTETSSIVFSRDGRTVATRGCDNTVKLWDARAFKKPVAVREGLANANPETDLIFGLDEQTLLTGTAAVPRKALGTVSSLDLEDVDPNDRIGGELHVLSRHDLSTIQKIPVSPGASTIRVAWHPKINQIFATTSAGGVHVYYSPENSVKGALLGLGKRAKVSRLDWENESENMQIIVPGAQDADSRGQGRSEAAKKRKMEKARADPKLTRMPDRPMAGPGRGGRVGAAATQHLVQSIFTDNTRSEDPREALLKYADSEADPKWTGAWAQTQPKTIYSKDASDGEGDDGGNK